jgi:hypothetical protein
MPDKKQSLILGTALTAVLSTSYLGLLTCCCGGVIIGALVTVWHYTSTHGITLTGGQGAVLGLTVGLLGALVSAVLDYALIQAGVRVDVTIMQFMLDRFGDQMPPESYDQMVEQMEQAVTFGKFALQALLGVAISAGIGAIGGAIGASIFKKGGDEPTHPAG